MARNTESSGAREDERIQASTARRGAQAKDGVDPQPGDPTSPKEAARRAAGRTDQLEGDGFGDHKGSRS